VANAGIWLSEIQIDKLIVSNPKIFPYPDNFKKRVCGIGFEAQKKGNYGIWDADLQLAEFENGDIAIAGSPLHQHFVASPDNHGQLQSSASFLVGPVMTAFIKGSASTFTMIPRTQNHNSGSKSLFIPYNDKLVVIYNDFANYINEKLTDDVDPGPIKMLKDLSLAAAVISKDGTIVSRKRLVQENFYNTSYCEFLSDKKMLIPSAILDKKTDEMKFVMISIE
jgi:hypothetical protein